MLKRFAVCTATIILICGLSGAAGVTQAASATTPAQTALYVLRVYVNSPADVSRLTSGGWDVLEARGKDYLLVMGDDKVVSSLRAQGWTVSIDHQVNAAGVLAPFAYDSGYHTVVEHYQHMDDVVNLHPDLALTVTYGISWQKLQNPAGGYDLRAICITHLRPGDCSLNPNNDKPRYFLMAAIHARELTTAELAWRWIDLLVNGYNVDPDITALLDYNEMWVVPVANPDGRAVVEQGGDAPYLQRKNVDNSHSPVGGCGYPPSAYYQDGIDLNRNASFKWNVAGTNPDDPCDQVYPGPSQASEPEEQALESLMSHLFRAQRGPLDTDAAPITTTGTMLTLHTYSNLVLLPWGWVSCDYGSPCPPDLRAPNDIPLRALAFHMSYFNGYLTGQASEALYAASGTTDDWAYGMLGIPGFTFEIGPADTSYCADFTPPYDCQDSLFWPQNEGAFLYQAKVARQPYALALGPTVQVFSPTPVVPLSNTQGFTAVVASNVYGANGFSIPVANPISAAEYTIDQPPWITATQVFSMSAMDGAFDSTSEVVSGTVNTQALNPGRHTIFVYGSDSAGNWGPVTAMWLEIPVPESWNRYWFPRILR